MKKSKDLIQKDVSHKVVALGLAILLFLSCGIIDAKAYVSEDKVDVDSRSVVFLSKRPSQSDWYKMYKKFEKYPNGEKDVEYFNSILKKWIKPYLVKTPSKVTKKASLKLKRKKRSIGVNVKSPLRGSQISFAIQYSTNKNFKNSKTLYTNKKSHITLNNLKRKTKYYVRTRIRKAYYYLKDFSKTCDSDWETYEWYYIFEYHELVDETFVDYYKCGPWSKIKSVKTK